MADNTTNKYGVQPAYNQSFIPSRPPSYNDAVNAPNHVIQPNFQPTCPPPAAPVPQGVYNTPPVPPYFHNNINSVVTVPLSVGPNPSKVMCPCCQTYVTTITKSVCQKSAHIAFILLCLFGCCLCSCIPYCLKSFKTIHHYCPRCQTFIGSYRN